MMEEENTTTSPAASSSSYENVYCDNKEGRLNVTDAGIFFCPYVPTQATAATPHDIPWRDTTYRDFSEQEITAGVQGYTTQVVLFHLKLGVLPSREVTFSMRHPEEWQRLQCDLDARGYGPPQAQDSHHEDTDHADAFYDEMERDDESEQDDAESDDVAYEDNEDDGVDDDLPQHTDRNMFHNESETEEVDWEEVDDTEEDDMSRQSGSSQGYTSVPNSSYYPVRHNQDVGSLVLTGSHLQFIPDRHSGNVKSLPWASLVGKPVYSPYNYPQALMRVHYYTTSGPNKKAGFELANHQEIARLEEDMRDRMRPWRNAPRQRVYVPPKMPKQDPNKPTVINNLKGGGMKKPRMFTGKTRVPFPVHDESITGTDKSTSYEDESMTVALTPLVARKVPYHKEEDQRRMLMLFCAYCCIVTVTILSSMVVIGYFFGPRKPKEYIRTKPPGTIDFDYLSNQLPTLSPTPLAQDQWSSGTAILKRDPVLTEMTLSLPNMTGSSQRPDSQGEEPGRGVTVAPFVTTSPEPTSSPPTFAPLTSAPTTQQTRSNRTILELLQDQSSDRGEAIRTSGTPQNAAYLLIKVSGVLDEAPSDAIIEQKYALATLYYATDGDEWNDGSEDWENLVNSDCSKPHVECEGSPDTITGIDMPNNNMKGFIPPEVAFLSNLQHLNFRDNDIESISTELGRLSSLKMLDVSGNPKLTNIPDEILALPDVVVKPDIL